MPENLTHCLRYGTHAEREFFLGSYAEDGFYDGVLVNANMVAWAPKAMSAFILSLTKPFFIDPQTHAFQHDFDFIKGKNGSPKQSITNLANIYGDLTMNALASNQPLNASDFVSDAICDEFAKKVVAFQKETIYQTATSGPESEYVKFALDDADSGLSRGNLAPAGIIAPYLYTESEELLEVNRRLVLSAKGPAEDKPLIAQLVLAKELLSDNVSREKVVTTFASLSAETIFVWIDEFDETEVSESMLSNFKDLVTRLSQSGKKVVNLYGGYFSILMTKVPNGLSGVCHGMEYGESRKVVPVGGGLPRAKYYFRPLHKRLSAEDFARIVSTRTGWLEKGSNDPAFAREVCDCEMCKDLDQFAETQTYEIKSKRGVRRGETSTSAAKVHSLTHYLINKKKEFGFVRDNTLPVLLKDLQDSYKRYSPVAGTNTAHLERWVKVLST